MRGWLVVPLLLVACQKGPDPALLTKSAEVFLQQGGLSVLGLGDAPCLRSVSTAPSVLGGLSAPFEPVVDFVEKHGLATVKRERSALGERAITVTPTATYASSWRGTGEIRIFCLGTLVLVKAQAVKDARPITAGAEQPYIIAGTPAQATRITYRLADLPGGTVIDDLKSQAYLLRSGSMSPADFGKELSAVAVLPVKPDGYTFTP